MNITEVTALFADLTQVELVHWVEQGWVVPDAEGTGTNALLRTPVDAIDPHFGPGSGPGRW